MVKKRGKLLNTALKVCGSQRNADESGAENNGGSLFFAKKFRFVVRRVP